MSNNLESLVKIIRSRKNKDKTSSYTAFLLSEEPEKCIDKLQEEFDELKEALNNLAAATRQSVVIDSKKKSSSRDSRFDLSFVSGIRRWIYKI